MLVLIKKQSQIFSFCTYPKPKVDLFDPERKGSLVFIMNSLLGNLPTQQSEIAISGFKLLFSANFLGVNG